MEPTIQQENVFIEKVISINRVTKVTKGGKNMSFAALVVVGDGKEKVGYALGKANEVAEAIKKGIRRAKKMMVSIKRTETTIAHEVRGKFGAVEVFLKPAAKGTGVIASSPVRAICEGVGIHDILTKV
ncbi:MAG: 30S ribosomal protein S5, partial [Candidatus Omnitrophica bacterium]|nr:30S ribosomal protein S5 [Candidatus Omnitrophota bacterium]